MLRSRLRSIVVIPWLLDRAVRRRRGALLRLRVLSLGRRIESPVLLRGNGALLLGRGPILRRRRVEPPILLRGRLPLLRRRRIASEVRTSLV